MANLETEVYELLKLFETSDIIKHDEEISNCACSSTPQAGPSSRFCQFFNFSHGLTTRLPISRFFGKYHSEMLFFKIKTEMGFFS